MAAEDIPRPHTHPSAIKDARTVWLNLPISKPMTVADCVRSVEKAIKQGWAIFDLSCVGTCPPYETRSPELYKAIQNAKKVLAGLEALQRSTGPGRAASLKAITLVDNTGKAIFDAGETYWAEMATKHEEAKEVLNLGLDRFKWLAYAGVGIVGLWAVARITENARHTTSNVRALAYGD